MGEGIPPFYQGGEYMAGNRKCHLCKEYIKDEEPLLKNMLLLMEIIKQGICIQNVKKSMI